MDLYRLEGGADLRVLDIPNVLKTSVCLIEWPDRLGAAQPGNRLGEKVVLHCCTSKGPFRHDVSPRFQHRYPGFSSPCVRRAGGRVW